MDNSVFKVMIESEWNQFCDDGEFYGSIHDKRDGFIHLSLQDQVEGVVERYFSASRPIFIAKFLNPSFWQQLKWEQASAGEFPHLYNEPLQRSEVMSFERRDNKSSISNNY